MRIVTSSRPGVDPEDRACRAVPPYSPACDGIRQRARIERRTFTFASPQPSQLSVDPPKFTLQIIHVGGCWRHERRSPTDDFLDDVTRQQRVVQGVDYLDVKTRDRDHDGVRARPLFSTACVLG